MIRTICLGALLAATPAAAGAQPELTAAPPPALPVAVSLDLETTWRLDPGYRLFSSDRAVGGGGISVSYDVLRGASRLALALGYHGQSSSNDWSSGGQVGLEVRSGSLSALLRWPLARWLEPQLRLAGDLSRGKFSMVASGISLADSSWSAGASAGAGLRLRTGTARILMMPGDGLFALAGIIEGGFHIGQPLSFDVRRQAAPAPDDRIAAPATSLGSLGRSYPYLRLSAALVF
jgi:hypothetical protein